VRLADGQHGVVSRRQLLVAGLTDDVVDWHVRTLRLHPVHRGVFALGTPRLTLHGHVWAALLACGGPGAAVLSHRAAAALWDLMPAPAGAIDVTTLRQSRSAPGIRVHRSRTLHPVRDVVTRDGLPVTAPMRTIADVAPRLSDHRLERLCDRAATLRLLDARSTATTRRVRSAMARAAHLGPQLTRSELEERFLGLVARARLPRPETNARIAGHEVDFLWREHHLIAETDGAAAHLTPAAFETDRARDAALLLAGFRVVRFTWRQLTATPNGVAATLAGLLVSPRTSRAA
jgi:very-short-patch-repair endonuclease